MRNLSSELNVCEGVKDQDELPDLTTPCKMSGSMIAQPSAADKEEEELQVHTIKIHLGIIVIVIGIQKSYLLLTHLPVELLNLH